MLYAMKLVFMKHLDWELACAEDEINFGVDCNIFPN